MRARALLRCLLPVSALVAGPVAAERWDFTPTLMLREIYSDNIALAEEDPSADWVTEITPGFTLRGQNDALKLNFRANAQNLYYRDGSANEDGDRSESNPQLQLSSTTTLLPSFFYLDVNGNAGQRIVSQNSQLSYDNIALSGDRVDYSTYSIAPFIKYASRAGINLEARAERTVNDYDSGDETNTDLLSNADGENYRFLLDNYGMRSSLNWRLSASRRYLDRKSDELTDPDFRQAQFDVAYQTSSALALLARAGRSENKLGGYNSDRNGDYSAAGLRWSPSRRFNLSAMAGSNYSDAEMKWKPSRRTEMMLGYRDTDIGLIVGPSWRADIKFRGRRMTASLGYNEEVTTEQQLMFDYEIVYVTDPLGGPPRPEPLIRFEIVDDEFERHRGTFTLGWQGRSGNITLTASSEDRQYLIRNELDGQADAVALSVKWPVGGGLDLVSQLREQRNVFSEDSGEERFSLASLGLRMNFSQRSYASLTAQQAEQDSERDSRSYEEGRVIAEVFLQF